MLKEPQGSINATRPLLNNYFDTSAVSSARGITTGKILRPLNDNCSGMYYALPPVCNYTVAAVGREYVNK